MRHVVILTLSLILTGCGGSVSEYAVQPARLGDYYQTASINILKDIDIGVEANNYIRQRPLLDGNSVLVADNNGYLMSINIEKSEIDWSLQLTTILPSDIGETDSVYLIGTKDGKVVALDKESHKEIWIATVSSEVLTRPVASEGIVIVKSVDGQITALDQKTGKQLWIYKRDVPSLSVRGHSTPVIKDGIIFTGLDNGRVILLDLRTGKMKWEKVITVPHGRSETERLVDVDADIVIDNDTAYIMSYQGRIVALDLRKGDFLWVKKMSAVKNMVKIDNTIYITDEKSHIWALDAVSGATIWKQESFTARNLTSPAFDDDYILFGDRFGYILVIAKSDGHQVAHVQISEAPIAVTPVVVDGRIGIISQDAIYHQLAIIRKGQK